MKKINLLVLLLIFAVLQGVYSADITVCGDHSVYNSYIWRGFELDSDPVMQTGLSLGYGLVSVSFWNSQDIVYEDSLNSAEFDITVDVSKTFDSISVSVGNNFYTFPSVDADSREAYLGISYDTILSPSLTLYLDYGDEDRGGGDGTYISASIAHSIGIGGIPLDLSGNIAVNNELFINGTGGDIGFSLSTSLDAGEGLSFSPSVAVVVPYGDMADSADGNQETSVYGGLSLSYGN